jgi:acyl-CoA hydrolase
VFVHGVAAVPYTVLNALAKRHAEEGLVHIELNHLHTEIPNPCSNPSIQNNPFFINNFFIGPDQRKAVQEGRSDYVPAFLSDIPNLMRKNLLPPDWALVNVSPPDKHGYCSLGVEVSCYY